MKSFISLAIILAIHTVAVTQSNSTSPELSKTIIEVNGDPVDQPANTGPFGSNPSIIPLVNDDNSYDVAWLCSTQIIDTFLINITLFSSDDEVINQIEVPTAKIPNRLLGFCQIPEDGSYVVAYATLIEYRIIRFKADKTVIFDNYIFGDTDLTKLNSRGQIGYSGSGGIAYNPQTQLIGFYVDHTKLFYDGLRHQGDYLGFLDLKGNQITKGRIATTDIVGSDWFVSHSFDQQIFADGPNFITMTLGDGGPRALQFAVWRTDLIQEQPDLPFDDYYFPSEYYKIPGEVGANYTFTLPGSIVKLPNGNFAVIFSTLIENQVMNIRLMILNPKGQIQTDHLITNYTFLNDDNNSNDLFGNAICPSMQIYGKDRLLLMWTKYAGTAEDSVFTTQTDFEGNPVCETTYLERAILSYAHDPVRMPNGNIMWVKTRGKNMLTIYRIKNPDSSAPLKTPLSDIQKPEFVAGSRAYIHYWEDGGYYSGTILEVLPVGYKVRYDDGYEETVENCDVKYLPPIKVGDLVKVKHPGNQYYILEVVEITNNKIKVAYQNDKFGWFPISAIMQFD